VGAFGSCLALKFRRERGCEPVSNVLFEIRLGKHAFWLLGEFVLQLYNS
jgi:hypothetical protein